MRLLVTGAAGMLGRDVLAAAAARGVEAIGLARAELDVRDLEAVRTALHDGAPDAVVNCAAWTDVDRAEADEAGAEAVNARGAGNVARAAAEAGAVVVHVSTDYVFDGAARTPYVESDRPNPLSAYGRTKLAGERAVAAAAPAHHVVRSAWLFGLGGRNFVETMLRLGEEREEVRVVDDQVGCPTWTAHLAAALLAVAGRRERFGVHHAAAAGACTWHDFARAIFARAGLECRVRAGRTADLGRPAPRPAYSVLGSERPAPLRLPPWPEGLAGYLAARVTAGAPT